MSEVQEGKTTEFDFSLLVSLSSNITYRYSGNMDDHKMSSRLFEIADAKKVAAALLAAVNEIRIVTALSENPSRKAALLSYEELFGTA